MLADAIGLSARKARQGVERPGDRGVGPGTGGVIVTGEAVEAVRILVELQACRGLALFDRLLAGPAPAAIAPIPLAIGLAKHGTHSIRIYYSLTNFRMDVWRDQVLLLHAEEGRNA